MTPKKSLYVFGIQVTDSVGKNMTYECTTKRTLRASKSPRIGAITRHGLGEVFVGTKDGVPIIELEIFALPVAVFRRGRPMRWRPRCLTASCMIRQPEACHPECGAWKEIKATGIGPSLPRVA